VVIVGAGLAGLSAGYELAQAGHEVTILEATMRPGGRALTIREPFSDGLYAEAGAARFYDIHDLTLKYVRLFNLPVVPFYPKELASVRYIGGKPIRLKAGESVTLSDFPPEQTVSLTSEEKSLGLDGMRRKYIGSKLKELGDVSSAEWPPSGLQKYDGMDFGEFLRGQGASPPAVALLGGEVDPEERSSALWYLRVLALEQGAKHIYKIQGGTDLLPRAFAQRLAQKIRYGTPVIRIEQQARGVQVAFWQGGAVETLAADYLICAVPFSLLKRIQVSPPFSAEKQRAIAELPYGSACRVFLQSRKRYWEAEGLNGFGETPALGEIWQPTFDQPGPRGILMSYVFASRARQLTAMPEGERLNSVTDGMEHVLPGMRANLEGALSKCWDLDPWARGAYVYLKPGQVFSLTPYLARPEGRVHFAGEHASAWHRWMQGALASGVRAAHEVSEAPL